LSGSFLLPNLVDSTCLEDKVCNQVRQYAYEKISICPLFVRFATVIDPDALLGRLADFNRMPRQFCRTLQTKSGTRIAF